jgi:tetratricopeptide (TPR) repeat protein
MYKDRHHRLCHRIIWPRFRYIVRYHWGPHLIFRYVYPHYHRKYIFVSLGGCWPVEYRYIRYYWYGWHPYIWCGYYPIPHQVEGDTYNYYTYNYYYSGVGEPIETYQSSQGITDNYIPPADHTTFADVREKLAKQKAEPDQQTLVDTLFEEAVKAFENGEYDSAVENFAAGVELAPEDMVLPFAYAQALFANEQYAEATEMLRTALEKVTPQEQGVFYPRGLYPDEDVLLWQIERLASEAEQNTRDADLQLLLGYQLLGIGELDAATEPLLQASLDVENATAAEILLELLEKLKADSITETETTADQTDYE